MDPTIKSACRPPPHTPRSSWDVAGLALARTLRNADKNNELFAWLVSVYRDMHAEHGREVLTATCRVLGFEFFVTADPENIKAILSTNFHDWDLGPMRKKILFPFIGNGIFISEGSEWEHLRGVIRPGFARDQIDDVAMHEHHALELVEAINSKLSTDWTDEVDLQPLFFRHTLDVATEFLLGENAKTQRTSIDDPETDDQGVKFVDVLQKATYFATRGGSDTWWRFWNDPEYLALRKQCWDFVDHYVELALEATDESTLDGKVEDDLNKGRYIVGHEFAKTTRDPVELRGQIFHILFAGFTQASVLSWLFLLLSKNPSIYQKLHEAVIEHFGTEDEPGPHDLSFSSLKSCSYLQWCLSEILRLYPPVPANGRAATCDTYLPRGGGPNGEDPVFVAKGQMIEYHTIQMHRRESVWGEDANEFKPERWEGKKMTWDYLPFNGGPRICPGQQFALTASACAIALVVRHFDTIEAINDEPIKVQLGINMAPHNGVKVKLRKASSAQ